MEVKEIGRVNVKPPFSVPDKMYTCVAKGLLSDLLGKSVDVFTLVYLPAGYTTGQFVQVIQNNPVMLTLRSSNGEVVYVPDDYLLSVDGVSYVDYVQKGLLVNVGNHTADTPLEDLVTRLEGIVQNELGVTPHISVEDISPKVSILKAEHDTIKETRNLVKSKGSSIDVQLTELQDHNLLLEVQVRSLLEFIRHYLKSCCNSDTCFTFLADRVRKVYYKHDLSHYVLVEGSGGNPFAGESNAFVSHLRRWAPAEII